MRKDLAHWMKRDKLSSLRAGEAGEDCGGRGGGDSQGQIPDGVNELKALFYKHKKATGGFVNRFVFTKSGFCVRGGLREEVTQGSNRDFCKG